MKQVGTKDDLRARFIQHIHKLYEIPGVGHVGGKMYNCGCGPKALLGEWAIEDGGC